MPRSPRLDFPGARHHVMNRGARRAPVFHTDRECALFADVLSELPARFGLRIHGYALMPNHYHLMVESVRGNLSEAMRHLGLVFTQSLNRMHPQWDGPVFRGRFHNEVVDSDAYWRHLLAYLHLNPVRAHLAKKPEDCLWTSHDAYAGHVPAPPWLTTGELTASFGDTKALLQYIHEVQIGRVEPPDGFDPERFFRPPSTEVPPVPRPEPRTTDEALDQVAAVCGVDRSALFTRQRGRTPNPAAWLAVWWLLESTDMSQRAVAELLGVSRGRIGQLRKKAVRLSAKQDQMRDWMQELLAELP